MNDRRDARPLAVLAISGRGASLGSRLRTQLSGDLFVPERFLALAGPGANALQQDSSAETLRARFGEYRGWVLVMPVGAAVRLIAPLLNHKSRDPAVVVLDEAGVNAVALLSGHVGGGNDLTREVSRAIGANPVITTAAELFGSLALDLLGREWGWIIEDPSALTAASAALVAGEPVGAVQEAGDESWWGEAPRNLQRYASLSELRQAAVAARLVITDRIIAGEEAGVNSVIYRPRSLVVGVGCVRGASQDEIAALIDETLASHGLAPSSIRALATIDVKRDEPGLASLIAARGWVLQAYTAEELSAIGAPSGASEAVQVAVGAPGVAEPAALLAAGASALLVPKTKTSRVTVAVARGEQGAGGGRLAVVGIGPGASLDLTERARSALQEADAVVGYHGYLDLIRNELRGAEEHGSPIGEETERCRLAIALSRRGQRVALISSGDAGIYGTAGLVLELLAEEGDEQAANRVEIIPGVTAANAAASLLGAPLMSDFATISLSDLMTPWSVIEGRLQAAAASDLVVALYNPASRRRRHQLARAREILLQHRPAATPVGLVRNATRPGQSVTLSTLGDLELDQVDMLSILIVGNQESVRVGDRMVTRRGYPVATHAEAT